MLRRHVAVPQDLPHNFSNGTSITTLVVTNMENKLDMPASFGVSNTNTKPSTMSVTDNTNTNG